MRRINRRHFAAGVFFRSEACYIDIHFRKHFQENILLIFISQKKNFRRHTDSESNSPHAP
jgi:hypothetical protein